MKNCICINDKGRPAEVPLSKWIKEGEEYTIIKMDKLNGHHGQMGVQLEEIDLSYCAPFLYFAANRFAPIAPKTDLEVEKLEEIFELA